MHHTITWPQYLLTSAAIGLGGSSLVWAGGTAMLASAHDHVEDLVMKTHTHPAAALLLPSPSHRSLQSDDLDDGNPAFYPDHTPSSVSLRWGEANDDAAAFGDESNDTLSPLAQRANEYAAHRRWDRHGLSRNHGRRGRRGTF